MKLRKYLNKRKLFKSRNYFLLTFFVLFIIFCAFFLNFKKNNFPKNPISQEEQRIEDQKLSLIKDISRGKKTEETKQNAFVFINRYINNGGNIYEIYDYINMNPELDFLKPAAQIYPEIFQAIEKRQVPHSYSDQGLYSYLAYLEILQRNGYENTAILGNLSYYYIKMGYYQQMILEDKAKGRSLTYPSYSKSEINSNIEKANFFQKEANNYFFDRSFKFESADVRGMIQYASSLRYFESLKVSFTSTKGAQEIFSLLTTYTHSTAREMYLLTALSNASTYLLINFSKDDLRNALYPFFDIPRATERGGIVKTILNSRFEKRTSRFRDLDIDSRMNIIALSNNVPEFKSWLKSNGWKEVDFK